MCETAKRNGCNITDPGITIKNCEASCCFEDKCNGINGGSGSGGNVVSTPTPTSKGSSHVASGSGGNVVSAPTPTSKGSSHVASFIATFLSVTALFTHFFIH